jgi:hypothetical protein
VFIEMAHRLDPPDGAAALNTDEIERRLRDEFPYVEADQQAGAEVVAGMIRQFERMSVQEEVVREHRRLQPSAVHFTVADSPDFGGAYLSFTAMPGRGLVVGYHSAGHEQSSDLLLRRCARALGYEITLL